MFLPSACLLLKAELPLPCTLVHLFLFHTMKKEKKIKMLMVWWLCILLKAWWQIPNTKRNYEITNFRKKVLIIIKKKVQKESFYYSKRTDQLVGEYFSKQILIGTRQSRVLRCSFYSNGMNFTTFLPPAAGDATHRCIRQSLNQELCIPAWARKLDSQVKKKIPEMLSSPGKTNSYPDN